MSEASRRSSHSAARIRRSVLFVPGDRADRHGKALASGADVVVLDLEDAVATERKRDARAAIVKSLREHTAASPPAAEATASPERVVRVNPIGPEAPGDGDITWFEADLAAVVPAAPDAIMVPKCEDVDALRGFEARILHLEREHGLDEGGIALHLIAETALGVLNALPLARASPRIEVLLFGAEDLAADIGARRTPSSTEVLYARSHVALAAGAARIAAIDQVFTTIEDEHGLRTEAEAARNLGYKGKMAIHPRQLAPIHEAFTPTREEAERANRLLEAVEKAGAGAGGVLRFEGRMVDRPLIEQARYTLRLARAAGLG